MSRILRAGLPATGPPARRGHAPRGQLDRLVDLQVAGAAAEVARERALEPLARGLRLLVEERLRGEQEARRAVAALRGAGLDEGLLEGMELAPLRHALDGGDRVPDGVEAEEEAGEHRLPVDEHRAGAALAELAAVLRPGQPHALAEHLEQGLVREERHVAGLPVARERAEDGPRPLGALRGTAHAAVSAESPP